MSPHVCLREWDIPQRVLSIYKAVRGCLGAVRHANTDEINSTNPLTTMTDHDQTATLEELLGRATPLDAQAAAAADPYETYETEELMHTAGVHKTVAPYRQTSPCTAADEAGDGLPEPGWVQFKVSYLYISLALWRDASIVYIRYSLPLFQISSRSRLRTPRRR